VRKGGQRAASNERSSSGLGEECWHTEACLTHFLVETLACQSISLNNEVDWDVGHNIGVNMLRASSGYGRHVLHI
jgi:hypothetical protein